MIRSETILAILAALLLSTIILNSSTSNANTSDTLLTTQLGINATSIANSFIERGSSAALTFDEYFLQNAISPSQGGNTSVLSSSLGKDAGETYQSLFDDVDDFNGLDTMITVAGLSSFRVRCTVAYFDPATGSTTTTKKWFKKFSVAVTDTIPGKTSHFFKYEGQTKAEVTKSTILSYFKFI